MLQIQNPANLLFGKFNFLQVILSVNIDLSNMAAKCQ